MATASAVLEGRRIRIRGTVQGVGFRPWVYRMARLAGVTGRVWNDSSGVVIEAFGDPAVLITFHNALQIPPAAAQIHAVDTTAIPWEPAAKFEIVPSQTAAGRLVSIPPDLATCEECVSEIFDPSNRRYRYAFTNCTNCGPRFTIATDIPYDRSATTMAPFEMCAPCRREYEDVDDVRFHAQPTACPVCGPKLTLHGRNAEVLDAADPIAAAGKEIARGWIVALKGLGGFHLACDATSSAAVALLRERKHRDEKPFAVMVPTLAAADAIAVLTAVERRLLTSVERPIVLAAKRQGGPLADGVAPRNKRVGLMLPYTPLHHLLLADAGRPLVMTSGNLSEEPIAYRNQEALRRLSGIADLFLVHDREIESRCDDSVVMSIAGRPCVMRRSRGYVPRAIQVPHRFARPVLACGALLKNTFCLADGDKAWLGPHVGDLENLETYDSYTTSIARFERFLQIRPEVIAYDMHPDYMSTSYAESRHGAVKVPVQHHHAHIVAAMAEHGLDGPVIGIAYDGTGYGTDGTSWGAEVLVATEARFDRVGTFRSLPLAGGDVAIRDPWRIALALVLDAYDGEPPPEIWRLFQDVADRDLAHVRQLLHARVHTPLARGIGRYFDGFGALFLGRHRASYEGQIALEWNQIANPHVTTPYPFDVIGDRALLEVDLRPAVRAAVRDWMHGFGAANIAAAFHTTLAEATDLIVRQTAARVGRLPVVASGGCFQNARLAESVRAALTPEFDVWLHERVPPGDGGIALGQAVIADAIARGRR